MLSCSVISAIQLASDPRALPGARPVSTLQTFPRPNSPGMNTCESISKQRTLSTFVVTSFRESQGVGRLSLTSDPPKPGRLKEPRDQRTVSGDILLPPPAPSFCYHPASHLRPT